MKILIVEEASHATAYPGLLTFLSSRGHDAHLGLWDDTQSGGTIEGLSVDAYTSRNKPDVLFIHFKMPVRRARFILTQLKKHAPQTKVIVITNVEPTGVYGVYPTLEKPIFIKDFMRHLE